MLQFDTLSSSLKALILFLASVCYCEGHGRLIEPPSRASAWRYGFQTPPDYNDHELYCGGFTRQWKQNGGKCGECGDAWDLPIPRPHEYGGQWGQGVIVRTYKPNSDITVRVELTASHMGYFEFRICQTPKAQQDCFDKNLLYVLGGSPLQKMTADLPNRFYPRNGNRIYEIKVHLPDMECEHCVLQWRYIAGNNWGICDDGNGAVGCGPQEEFRSCSDISITNEAQTRVRPMNPKFHPTLSSKDSNGTTSNIELDDSSKIALHTLVAVFILLIFCLTLWIAYRRNERRVREVAQRFLVNICKTQNEKPSKVNMSSLSNTTDEKLETTQNDNLQSSCDNWSPPVPPPRTKRLQRNNELVQEQ